MQSVIELTDKILSLTVAHPRACQLAAHRLMTTRDGMRKLSVLFNSIGFEYSKQLFDRIRPVQWKALMDASLETADLLNVSIASILLEIHTQFLIETMSSDPKDGVEDPFYFLKELDEAEISTLLGDQDPTQIAFISLYFNCEEMAKILGCLPKQIRRQVVLHILRLERLPEEALNQAALVFAQRIKSRFEGLFDKPITSQFSRPLEEVKQAQDELAIEFNQKTELDKSEINKTETLNEILSEIDLEEEQRLLNFFNEKYLTFKSQEKI